MPSFSGEELTFESGQRGKPGVYSARSGGLVIYQVQPDVGRAHEMETVKGRRGYECGT